MPRDAMSRLCDGDDLSDREAEAFLARIGGGVELLRRAIGLSYSIGREAEAIENRLYPDGGPFTIDETLETRAYLLRRFQQRVRWLTCPDGDEGDMR